METWTDTPIDGQTDVEGEIVNVDGENFPTQNEVVSEAVKHGIKIKPLHGANTSLTTSDDTALIKKDKKYIGLGKKFYGFRNPKEEDKEELKDFSSLSEAQCEF